MAIEGTNLCDRQTVTDDDLKPVLGLPRATALERKVDAVLIIALVAPRYMKLGSERHLVPHIIGSADKDRWAVGGLVHRQHLLAILED